MYFLLSPCGVLAELTVSACCHSGLSCPSEETSSNLLSSPPFLIPLSPASQIRTKRTFIYLKKSYFSPGNQWRTAPLLLLLFPAPRQTDTDRQMQFKSDWSFRRQTIREILAIKSSPGRRGRGETEFANCCPSLDWRHDTQVSTMICSTQANSFIHQSSCNPLPDRTDAVKTSDSDCKFIVSWLSSSPP